MNRSISVRFFWNASQGFLSLLLVALTLAGVSQSQAATEHLVRPGDSLWGIATHYGVSQEAIRATNRLPNDQVVSGQRLVIPVKGTAAPAKSSTAASKPGIHVVTPGQTFSGIARKYGVTMAALQAANPGVNPEPLLVDTRLAIPGQKTTPVKTALNPSPPPPVQRSSALDYPPAPGSPKPTKGTGSVYHTVRPGDTLTGLAQGYGVSTVAIQSANQIANPDILTVGQRLTIPGSQSNAPAPSNIATASYRPQPVAPPPPAITPPVQVTPAPPPPMTAASPAAEPKPIKPPTSTAAAPSKTSRFSDSHRAVLAYRLEKGDSLDTVANLFGTTAEQLRDLNKLPPGATLGAGDELVVPAMASVEN